MTAQLRISRAFGLAAAMLSVAGVGARLANAAPGDIFNLGTLGGTLYSIGNAINDAGQVAGKAYTTGDATAHAFRYTGTPGSGGAMVDLGTLGGTVSGGNAINDAGQVVGESLTSGNLVVHAFRYTGTPGSSGAMADLGTLGGTNFSQSSAINGAGQVAGSSYLTGNFYEHAFRYTGTPGSGGAMADLGTLGGANSDGYGINDVGQVVGRAQTTGDAEFHAFRYSGTPGSGGAMADLGTLGGTYCEGKAINDAGQVAGFSGTTGDAEFHAFRYTGTPGSGGAMADLGPGLGHAINDAGFVVGDGESSPTLWLIDAANTAVDLDAWLDANNPTLGAYWTLYSALGINNNGLITGSGGYDDGPGGLSDGYRAFILDASSLITAPGLPGDYNHNGVVDAADYVLWRKSPGAYDGNPAGYNTWRANFDQPPGSGSGTAVSASTAVPEPMASFLLLSTVAALSLLRIRAALSSQKLVLM